MTITQPAEDEAAQEATAFSAPLRIPTRSPRARAYSVTLGDPPASSPAPPRVTESDRPAGAQERAQALADGWAARLKASLTAAPPLAQARPPSLALAVADIRARAARHDGLLLQSGTWAWGCLYLLLMFAVYAVLFTVRTPLGAAVGAAAGWIIWTCI